MARVGTDGVKNNFGLEANKAYLHNKSSLTFTVSEPSEIYNFGIRQGATSNAGKTVEMCVRDVTGGGDNSPVVGQIAILSGTSDKNTFLDKALTGSELVPLEVGKTYALSAFSAGWSSSTNADAYFGGTCYRQNGITTTPDPFIKNDGSFNYPITFYADTRTAINNIDLIAVSATLTFTGSFANLGEAKNSEQPSLWFDGETWAVPTWGSSWWGGATKLKLTADSSTLLLSGSVSELKLIVSHAVLIADSATLSIVGSEAFLGEPQGLELIANSNTLRLYSDGANLEESAESYGLGNNVVHARQENNNLFSQHEDSTVLYSVNWASELDTDSIMTSNWTDETGGVVLNGKIKLETYTSVKVTGAIGRYVITNTITTKQGITKQRQLIVKIIANNDSRGYS